MIKLADINKDGFVDFEEFRLLVASNWISFSLYVNNKIFI
jgi:hypothetical protein